MSLGGSGVSMGGVGSLRVIPYLYFFGWFISQNATQCLWTWPIQDTLIKAASKSQRLQLRREIHVLQGLIETWVVQQNTIHEFMKPFHTFADGLKQITKIHQV